MLLFLFLLFCIISRREQAPALLCRRKNFADEARRASKAKAYLAYVEPLARKQRSMRSFFKDKKRPIVLHTIGRGQTRYHLSSVQKLLHPHGKKALPALLREHPLGSRLALFPTARERLRGSLLTHFHQPCALWKQADRYYSPSLRLDDISSIKCRNYNTPTSLHSISPVFRFVNIYLYTTPFAPNVIKLSQPRVILEQRHFSQILRYARE